MKIINKIRKSEEHGRVFYSFEYFPPKTEIGVQNLYDRMERMATLDPLFCDVTWGADGKASEKTLDISVNAKKFLGLEVLMHMVSINQITTFRGEICANVQMSQPLVEELAGPQKIIGDRLMPGTRMSFIYGIHSDTRCNKGLAHSLQ